MLRWLISVAALVVVVVVVAAFYPTGAVQSGPGQVVGAPVPNLTFARLGGGMLNLQALRGHYVLINLWASWCGPCRRETPALERLHRSTAGRLIVVGADEGEDVDIVRAFAQRFRLTYPLVLDTREELGRLLHTAGLPSSFFLDRQGVIRDAVDGEMTYEMMVQKTRKLMEGQ